MKAASVDVAAMIGIGLTDAATRTRQVRELADRIVELAAASAANKVVEQQITPETRRAPRLWALRGRRAASPGSFGIARCSARR
jgi:hypothetical protein